MQIVKLNLIPGGVLPVCFASQNDTGRVIRFLLFEGENIFTLSGAESIALRLQKPDGSELVESVTNTGADYVDVVTTADTCDTAGASVGEIVITDGGDVIGSANFGLFVESDAFDSSDIVTQTASGAIATFETNIETAFVSLKSDINPVQDLHGYSKPWSGGGGKNKVNYNVWKTSSITNGTAVWENNGVKLTATANDCYTQAPNGFPSGAIIPISEGETITLSWEETTNLDGSVYIFPNNTTTGMVRAYNQQVKKLSYTATSGVTYVTFRFGVSNSGDTIAYKNIQIEKGSQATSWEPYENICPISGFSALNDTRTGKNLAQTSLTGVNIDGSGLLVPYSAYDMVIAPVKAGQTYTATNNESNQFICGFFTSLPSQGSTSYNNSRVVQTSKTITAPIDGYIAFRVPTGFANYQLELGSTATNYEPYNGQTVTVNFGQTVYGGVADVTGGTVNVTHKKITFTGEASENWYYTSSLNRVYINVSDAVADITNPIMSNIIGFNSSYTPSDYTGHINPHGNFEIFAPATITNANDWKTWLSSNNIELVYELATPIEITTTPENLTAIVGQNNVYSDTNGDTEVEYYIEV